MLQFHGVAYAVGDFAVCVGRAMMRPGEELRGYMVEVEYLPVQEPALAQAALQARLTRLVTVDLFALHAPRRRCAWPGTPGHRGPRSGAGECGAAVSAPQQAWSAACAGQSACFGSPKCFAVG